MQRILSSIVVASCLITACSSGSSKKKDSSTVPAENTAANNTSTTTTTQTSGTLDSASSDNTMYLGFDGSTDFSIVIPGFRKYTISDTAVAKIEEVTVQLSDTIISQLLAAQKAKNPNFNETKFKEGLARNTKAYKITPLKAGSATLNTASGQGPGGSGGPGGGDPWGAGSAIKLVVGSYTAAQVAAGKKRYTTSGEGNLKACQSCHETGVSGAPPHALGNIKYLSDAEALQWVTTGKVKGRTAKITHTWEFSADDQKNGIVAYLRSIAAHDADELTKLMFEQRMKSTTGTSTTTTGGSTTTTTP